MSLFQFLDVVALVEDLPQEGLRRGQVGTVIAVGSDDHLQVEFCEGEDCVSKQVFLTPQQIKLLHYDPPM